MNSSKPKTLKDVVEYALILISKMSYSKKALCDKLLKKGYSAEEAQKAVNRLVELNYLNDENFAKIYGEYLSKRNKGEYFIKAELEKHEIAPETIHKVLKAVKNGEEPYIQITALLKRKYPKFSNNASEKRKAAAFFTRRGFNLDDILKAFRHYKEEI